MKNYISQQFNFSAWYFSPRKVTRILLSAIALLIFFSILEKIIVDIFTEITNTDVSTKYFNFDFENNFPSFYSAFTLGFSSYLLWKIADFEKLPNSRFTRFWRALSFIFLYMAIDEAVEIHELSIAPLRNALGTSGFLYFAWIIPASILLIVFLVVFKDFIYNLPPKTRNLFLLAGGIYVGGALGMESIGGYMADTKGFGTTAYWLAAYTEELLEMFGVVVFIYSLLSYLQNQISMPIKLNRK